MKLLAIDVGNTSTTFGVFEGKDLALKKKWDVETILLPAYLTKKGFSDKIFVIVSSVVPDINRFIRKKFKKPIFILPDKVPGITLKVKKPAEVGADRVVNALAARNMFGGNLIVIDFGSATTFDIVSESGEYQGGAIAPGIGFGRDILHERTAQLPLVKVMEPKSVIGKDTHEAILSGLIYGYASLVDGMITRILTETGKPARVVATGGFARLIKKYSSKID
ncbi:MAG: type III pantothenate kinase, partial [Candidatus Margulisbacteria bacterium]|nr:type III pantothenate kinase [Candidatus Margulisiibacteriota bacterium]